MHLHARTSMPSTPLGARAQGDNLFKLFGATSWLTSSSMYMLLAACMMIPTVWLPDLKTLSVLGAAGVTATCTVSAAVGWRGTGGPGRGDGHVGASVRSQRRLHACL